MIDHLNPIHHYIIEKKQQKQQQNTVDKPRDTIVGEIFLYDQFGYEFDDLISKYQTPQAICGYAVLANIRILHKYGVDEGIKLLRNNPDIRHNLIEEAMQHIQMTRRTYADSNTILQSNKHEYTKYMKDWVANYEISDYLRLLQLNDVYFIRNVAYEHPELAQKTQYEEADRLPEEQPYIGDKYFVDSGFEQKFIRRDKFKLQHNQLFIIDTLGHFICGVYRIEYGKRVILILDTMQSKHSEHQCVKELFNI